MFYLVSLITNQEDQHQSTIAEYDELEKTIIGWHNQAASLHNAPDVQYAVVEILNDGGLVLTSYQETVSHPKPVPEPEITPDFDQNEGND